MAFDLRATLRLDSSDFSRGLKDAQTKLKAFSDKAGGVKGITGKISEGLGGVTSAMKTVGLAAVAGAGAVVAVGKSCVEAAANAQALDSQFEQVFSGMEKEASKGLKEAAKSTGLMETQMKGSFTQIASFAKTTGMSTADALNMSERAMIVAADSAAFYDRSLVDVTSSLQSFLKGNYENDAALGLSCTETTRNAKAMDMFGKEFKELSEEQKQQTLLKMVEDANKLSGALGQSTREAGSYQAQMDKLRQCWTDFKAVIGGAILEPVVNAMSKLVELMQTEKFQTFAGKVGEAFDALVQIGSNIIKPFIEDVKTLWGKLNPSDGEEETLLSKAFDKIKAIGRWMIDEGNGETMYEILRNVSIAIGLVSAAMAVLNFVMSANPIGIVIIAIAGLVGWLTYLWNESETARGYMKDFMKGLENWVPVLEFFADTVKAVWKAFKTLVGWIKDAIEWQQKWNDTEGTPMTERENNQMNTRFMGRGRNNKTNGKGNNAGGWSYIPSDGLRYLHKGERVLTPEENKEYTGGANITYNITLNNNGTGNSSRDADVLFSKFVKAVKQAGGAGA